MSRSESTRSGDYEEKWTFLKASMVARSVPDVRIWSAKLGRRCSCPGSSGSVAANKSLPTAEEIGAAVAAALHRVPLVVPQDAVTDSILRRTPNSASGAPGLGVE